MKARTKTFVMMGAAAMLLTLSGYAAEEGPTQKPVELKTELDKVSYSIGTQMGQSLKRPGIEVNLDMVIRGLKDALDERDLALTQDEMRQVMRSFQQRMMAEQTRLRNEQAVQNLAEGKAFLEENKKQPGVKVLPSGLQYIVLEEGAGRTPAADDRVKVHYRGTLLNGEEFDSSYERNRPFETAVKGRIIKGWQEALQLMKEGAKWQLFIPADLAYREQGRGSIPPNATLIFEVELLEILNRPEK